MQKRQIFFLALFSAVVLLAILSRTQFEIRNDVEINAPPEKVWKTVIDFQRYREWNSQLQYLGGEVKPGGRLHLKLSAQGAEPYEFTPIVSYWEENKRFAWLAETGLPRIFDGEHFFELQDIGNGKTLVINREEYRGILSLVMKNLPMMKDAPAGFALMNTELKTFCEKP
ncbi:MAG: SRPBCC domain-containing protein [Candidatus Kapabacteria bacterium]|jgi:hypothetical protein|nr:SRPBCC domain-containing protein [Candidatus Kapabacteria bacterium]